ncbi:MAG: hypothetical protein HPY60_01130 [Candidatus Methanofastidiosum sp.]|nr:hypothetical protein [Methanofastidiosum sp.]
MKLKFYSHRFAEEVLKSPKYIDYYNMVISIFENCPVFILDKPKYRHRGRKNLIFTTDQSKINDYVKERFRLYNWEIEPLITNDDLTKIKADYKKDRIQIEVQFGNMARWYADIFKFQISYSLDEIDLGISVIPTQIFAKTIDENVAFFERVIRELRYAKMSVTIPLLIIGLDMD